MGKINILKIIESSETGGAEAVFLQLSRGLDPDVFRVHPGLFYEGWLSKEFRSQGINPVFFHTSGAFDVSLLRQIVTYVKKHRISLIHAHLFGANVYSSIAGKLCNIPVVSTFHGAVDVADNDRLKRLKFTIINRFSKRIIFVSESLKRSFCDMKLAKGDISEVIQNGVNLDKFASRQKFHVSSFRQQLGISEEDYLVGSVGDLRASKGYDNLIEAARLCKLINDKIKFVIVGSVTEKIHAFKSKIAEYELQKTVIFTGYRDDVPNILPLFDVFLLPSISEGFSLVTVEAMASGVPVVVTRSGGPEEIVEDRISGVLIDINAPEQICKVIFDLKDNDEKRYKMISNGKKRVKERYSMQTMLEAYQILYLRLIS